MRVNITKLCFILTLLFQAPIYMNAQDVRQTSSREVALGNSNLGINETIDLSPKFLKGISKKIRNLEKQVDRQTRKYLSRLQKNENKIESELEKSDSSKASDLFPAKASGKYASLYNKYLGDTSTIIHSMGPEYLPFADSLEGTLGFLQKNPQFLDPHVNLNQIDQTLANLKRLNVKFQDADQIKSFIQSRKAMLSKYLSSIPGLPGKLKKAYTNYDKQVYYYGVQIKQYRQTLNDPGKMLKMALSILDRVPGFSNFLKKNSFLAGLFAIPANYGSADALSGLQTRDEIMGLIRREVGAGGPNASFAVQSAFQQGQASLNRLKNKLSALGGGSGDIDIPDFKPVEQKTKTFFQRLEYGTNLQTLHATNYFPTTTDIGFSLGYKISDNNSLGIGASYKIGWGTIRNIHVTNEGIGLRSYLDIKAKGTFYLSGGLEYNYQPSLQTEIQKNIETWQKSGLVGISKIVSMKTKLFKKTKIQLLWDFLSYSEVPRSQPIKFRVGYIF